MEQNENGGSGPEASPLTPEQKFAHDLNELHSPTQKDERATLTHSKLIIIAKLAAMGPNTGNTKALGGFFDQANQFVFESHGLLSTAKKETKLMAEVVSLATVLSNRIQVLDGEEKARMTQEQAEAMAGAVGESNRETTGVLVQSIVDLQGEVAEGNIINQSSLGAQERQLTAVLKNSAEAFALVEDKQVARDIDAFLGEPPVWFSELSNRQQEMILGRLYLVNGANAKRIFGHGKLDDMVDRQRPMRLESKTLDALWREMPGFRIVTATMTNDLFEIKEEKPLGFESAGSMFFLSLKPEVSNPRNGVSAILTDFSKYKEGLIEKLTTYFEEHPEEGQKLNDEGWPKLRSERMARMAVAAAWNWFYVGNALDSADVGDPQADMLSLVESAKQRAAATGGNQEEEVRMALRNNPKVGRKVQDIISIGEQVRSMCGPFQKSWGKAMKGPREVGTEEDWGGSLGQYVAERLSNSSKFAIEVGSGQRTVFPSRLIASWFDLTKIDDSEMSLAELLVESRKDEVSDGLFDFVDPDRINFAGARYSELWGGYADTFDSAMKVWEAISGANPPKPDEIKKWGHILTGALIKLQKPQSPLAPIYKDPDIIVSAIAGSMGVTMYLNEMLLTLDETSYDSVVNTILADPRLIKGLRKKGSLKPRKHILKKLNAKDLFTWMGSIGSSFAIDRGLLKRKAAVNQAKIIN